MGKTKTSEKWIQAGYELFAHEGPHGLQVERLARILGLNKSGFYHYFGDANTFIVELIDHHRDCIEQYVSEIHKLKDFDPGYLQLMIKYHTVVMVHMQLGKNRNNKLFSDVYADLNSTIALAISPLWANYVNMPDNPDLAIRYFEFVRGSFNAQVRFSDLKYEILHAIVHDAKLIVEEIVKREQPSITTPIKQK
jgi:AcrR family transcriptional regulator